MKRKSVLKKVGIGVLGVAALLAGVIATRPSTFHVERSTVIAAKPEAAFARVNDFHAWQSWSPYEKYDPNMARSYAGPTSGNGSTYAWKGNKDIGEGKMTIVDSRQASRIAIKLEFLKPFECTNDATFTFEPQADGTTKVTWAMDGTNTLFGKAASLVFDMDELVGGDFARGLDALKRETEGSTTKTRS
jgi:hypothetical protein